ncbi:hypothetical protein [Actinomadura macrotermitis]|uniref:hypothetical protein n=1 Tax=Actinomadura macrotermitis TaxID=2585200 RepID=UPI00129801CC|nr:hypothetical protein [Actinomadura macrotermitis]
MIIPLRDAHGVPDLARLDQWTATCDRCPASTLLADIAPWLMGMHQDQAVYCPACTRALAARLIDSAFRPAGLPGLLYDTRRALIRALPDHTHRAARQLACALKRRPGTPRL